MNHENFGAQVHSYAAGTENPGCKGSSGKGMKEARNDPSLATGKGKEQKRRFILEAQRDRRKVHFAALMDLCHLKKAELKPKIRVVLRGDIVKDDSGACAVFTEQDSCASQMTAAKVMDVIARLPNCDGQAADTVSACTQVK